MPHGFCRSERDFVLSRFTAKDQANSNTLAQLGVSENLYLQLQLDPEFLFHPAADDLDQIHHIPRRCSPVIHEKIGVYRRDLNISHACPFQPRLLDEPTREIARWILKHRTNTRVGWLGPAAMRRILTHACNTFL